MWNSNCQVRGQFTNKKHDREHPIRNVAVAWAALGHLLMDNGQSVTFLLKNLA